MLKTWHVVTEVIVLRRFKVRAGNALDAVEATHMMEPYDEEEVSWDEVAVDELQDA